MARCMSSPQKTGILLLNLGTPDAPDVKSVRRYLREFLSDPKVIDLPALTRWVLLNCVILPFRPKQSAHAYQQIWTDKGSPLLLHSQALTQKLADMTSGHYTVALGMRYGKPNIASAIEQLRDCEHIVVMPLFPQYSTAATESAVLKATELLDQHHPEMTYNVVHDFFDHPAFIDAYASLLSEKLKTLQPDMLLLSYHGLPERHLDKGICDVMKTRCSRLGACPKMHSNKRYCYRAQCYETSRLLTTALSLDPAKVHVAFQSRLGKTPWIKPYTDVVLEDLAKNGVKKLAVACPSFVADCLETLEEIGIRANAQWIALGGESLTLLPCLNDDAHWVKALATLIHESHT